MKYSTLAKLFILALAFIVLFNMAAEIVKDAYVQNREIIKIK